MTQKVVVDVTPAEVWPRTFDSFFEAEEAGAVFEVLVNGQALEMYHFENNTPISKKDSPGFADSTSWIGFPDFESAARWWLDPKPVVDSPAPVRFMDLEAGDFFISEGKVYRSNLGSTATSIDPFCSINFEQARLVTPFYGKITIEVKPE